MIAIENTLISEDLVEEYFACDIAHCKGICCYEGDAGAPLEKQEINWLENNFSAYKEFLTKEGIERIEQVGVFEFDINNEYVTPLIANAACAFATYENGVYGCALEKAYYAGQTDFIKPISCHLYPVRLTEYSSYTAVNYHQWRVCGHARFKGETQLIKVYEFLKTPLIRKFGEEWYNALEAYDYHLSAKK